MRPTVRPTSVLTIAQICDAVEQHFLVEKNPQCVFESRCVYGQTGCGVGCLLTQEDADKLDQMNFGSIAGLMASPPAIDILRHYFTLDGKTLECLQIIQRAHDRCHSSRSDLTESIADALRAIRATLSV